MSANKSTDSGSDDWGASFLGGMDKTETDWESIFDRIIESHRNTGTGRQKVEPNLVQQGNDAEKDSSLDHDGPKSTADENESYTVTVTGGCPQSPEMLQNKELFASKRSKDFDSFDIEFSYHAAKSPAAVHTGSPGSERNGSSNMNPVNAKHGGQLLILDIERPIQDSQRPHEFNESDERYKSKGPFYDSSTSGCSSNSDEKLDSSSEKSSLDSTESGSISYGSDDIKCSFTDTSEVNGKEVSPGEESVLPDQVSEDSYSSTASSGKHSEHATEDESGRSSLGMTSSASGSAESSLDSQNQCNSFGSSENSDGSSSQGTESDSAIDDDENDDDVDDDEVDDEDDDVEEYGSSEFEGILDDSDEDEEEDEEPHCVKNISLSEDVFKALEEKAQCSFRADNDGEACSGNLHSDKEAQKDTPKDPDITLECSKEPHSPKVTCSVANTTGNDSLPQTPGSRCSFRSCSFQQLPGVPLSTPKTLPVVRNSVDEILARNICGSAEPYQRRDSPILRLVNQSTPIMDFHPVPSFKMEDLMQTPLSSTPKAESVPLIAGKPPRLGCEDHNGSLVLEENNHNVATAPGSSQGVGVRHRAVSGPATPSLRCKDHNVSTELSESYHNVPIAAGSQGVGVRHRTVSGPSKVGAPATADSSVTPKLDAAKLEKMQRRRAKIAQEILDTEATYQQHLHLVLKYFEFPLRKAAVLPDRVLASIFGNIRQISSLSEELMTRLSQPQQIGQAFLLMGPFLKLYSMYANNHEQALATLLEWDQKCPEFAAFRRQQEDLAAMNGLKLNALLITPVQRIPRYKLLLTELMQNTPTDHKDYPALQEAVDQISAVASHINEHIKQQDNFSRMLQIQKSLSGAAAPRLLIPGRIFIKEGTLRKVSKKGGRSYERMFYLFSDLLMYAKPRLLDAGTTHHGYTCCCVLPLQHCHVMRVFGHSAGQGALFSITCKHESVLLYSDQKTVDSWIQAITDTIDKLRENRKSLRKVSSSARDPQRNSVLVKLRRHHHSRQNMAQKKTSNAPGLPSPSQALKRALKDTDINCLSPRRKAKLDDGEGQEDIGEKLSSFGAALTGGCMSGKSSLLQKKKAQIIKNIKGFPHRYPSTPDALDSLSAPEQDVIDLDQSDVWCLENDTTIMEDSAEVTQRSTTRRGKDKQRSGHHSGGSRKDEPSHNGRLEAMLSSASDATQHLVLPSPAPHLTQGYGATCTLQ